MLIIREKRNSEYREGVYVGYRYYDTVKKKFCFLLDSD